MPSTAQAWLNLSGGELGWSWDSMTMLKVVQNERLIKFYFPQCIIQTFNLLTKL